MAMQPYWKDARPSDAKRWQGADSAEVLSLGKYGDPLFRLYRRYANQWNEIELDQARDLSEHTHCISDARVVGSHRMFILHNDISREDGWILELKFARGFHVYYPGWSCGLNALRTLADLHRAVLHWRGNGRTEFDEWLIREQTENASRVEWTEYKS